MSKRYYSIDSMKIVAAFLVICIHTPFKGEIGELVKMIARIAVPFFFVISGFFSIPKSNLLQKLKEKIKSTLVLAVLANLMYLIINVVTIFIEKGNVLQYFVSLVSINNVIKLLFFNVSPLSEHLWYLWAYLYVLIIYYLLNKNKILKYSFYFIPVLLAVDLLFGKYSLLFLGGEFPYYVVRNFLFVGIPYFLLGVLIGMNKEKLTNVNSKLLFLGLFTSILLTFFERLLLNFYHLSAIREHYLGTTFTIIFLFILLVSHSDFTKNSFLPDLGSNYSLYVYIIHPAVIIMLSTINFSNSFSVFIISLLLAIFYRKIRFSIKCYK